MEFHMESAVFTNSQTNKPSIKFTVVKYVRFLEKVELDKIGVTLIPKIEVIDD